jgi:hypothetical protein
MRHAKPAAADATPEPATPDPTRAADAAPPARADDVELRDREAEPVSRPAAGRRPKRPSVPSWDDIMFGAKQD